MSGAEATAIRPAAAPLRCAALRLRIGGGAVLPHEVRGLVFWEVLAFLATVVVAYVYAWRRGVFRWR